MSVDDDGEGGIAEDLALKVVRGGEELGCGSAEESVGVAVAFARGIVAAGDQLGARVG